LLTSLTDANTENSRQQVLFNSASDQFTITARRQQFKYTVGQTITLDYTRFGLSGDMIILGIRENTMNGQTTFRLWSDADISIGASTSMIDPIDARSFVIDPADSTNILEP